MTQKATKKKGSQVALSNRRIATIVAWLAEHVVSIVIGLVSLSFFLGSWYMKSNLEIELRRYVDTSLDKALSPIRDDIRTMKSDISTLQTGLARIQGMLGDLTGVVYKQEVSALGLKEPQVVPIRLSGPPAPASPVIRVSGTFTDGATFHLEFKVEAIDQDSIKFLVNGAVGRYTLTDAGFTLPRQVGVPFELNKVVYIPGMPKILLTIIDFPTKDTAIVAVGEKVAS